MDAGKNTVTYGYVPSTAYTTKGTGTTNLIQSITQSGINFVYEYDSRGNIISETRNGVATTYEYDALGQLVRVNDPHENATWVYTYDCGGNILSKNRYAYTTGAVGAVDETIPYTYGDVNWKDKLTNFNGNNISYDAIGNPLSDGIWTYTWEKGRQLKVIEREDTWVEFKYDHNGMRTQKVVQQDWYPVTTNYTWHGKLLTHMTVDYHDWDEVAQQDVLHFYYDAQKRPAKVKFNGTIYTYIHNLQGDIVGILDSTGVLVVEYKYDAWGKPLDSIGTMVDTLGKRNPFRYRGYVYDEETGLYYLQSRYYCSEIHRFINSDSVMGIQGKLTSHNMFAYCCNVPVMLADKNGRNASMVTRIISTVKKLGNAIVSACILNLVDAVTQTKNTRRNGKLISCSIKNATITVKDAESHNDAVENTVKWTKRLLGGAVGYSVALPSLKGITGIITAWAAEDSVDVISDMFVDSHAIIPGEYLSIQATYQYTHKDYFIDCSNDFVIYELRIYGSGYIEAWEFRCGCGIISAGAEKIGSITFAEMGF